MNYRSAALTYVSARITKTFYLELCSKISVQVGSKLEEGYGEISLLVFFYFFFAYILHFWIFFFQNHVFPEMVKIK